MLSCPAFVHEHHQWNGLGAAKEAYEELHSDHFLALRILSVGKAEVATS